MQSKRKRMSVLSLMTLSLAVWIFPSLLNSGLSAQVAANPPIGQQAQIDKGRQVVMQACAACHPTIQRMLQGYKQSPEQWRSTVFFMISRGAQVMPDEIEPVIAYVLATAGSGQQTAQASGAGRGRGGGLGQQPPESGGRAILEQNCQQCHDLAVASTKMPSEEWSAVIARMINYGARLAPADQQTLIGYLNGLVQ
jgi:mono/diheme cytochrome c family protein